MDVKDILFKELIKKGHSETNGNRVWNLANRSNLHLTKELSQGFIDILDSDVWKKGVLDDEMKLIDDNVESFIKAIGTDEPFNLIDIGCGDGRKAKKFIAALPDTVKIRYCPVSPDDYLVDTAAENIKSENFSTVVDYVPYTLGFADLGKVGPVMRCSEFQRNVILLHGSILASYEINEYLFTLSNGMFDGDYIIIGNGIRKGERLVEPDKYKDTAFHNWFIHIIHALGFTDDEVEYDAAFRNYRMESFYKLKVDKTITHDGKELAFKKGDEIVVFILYKYYLEEFDKFFNMYFSTVDIRKDNQDEYILALCKK